MTRLLALVDSLPERAVLIYGQGMLARRRNEPATAIACFTQSLDLYRHLADERGTASALRALGFMHYFLGNDNAARPFFEEALQLFRALADHEGIAVTLDNLGYIEQAPQVAARLHGESLALRRRSGNLHGVTMSLAGLAYSAIAQADYMTARKYAQEKLQINEKLGNQNGIANALHILGHIAYGEGDLAGAQAYFERGVKASQEYGDQ